MGTDSERTSLAEEIMLSEPEQVKKSYERILVVHEDVGPWVDRRKNGHEPTEEEQKRMVEKLESIGVKVDTNEDKIKTLAEIDAAAAVLWEPVEKGREEYREHKAKREAEQREVLHKADQAVDAWEGKGKDLIGQAQRRWFDGDLIQSTGKALVEAGMKVDTNRDGKLSFKEVEAAANQFRVEQKEKEVPSI